MSLQYVGIEGQWYFGIGLEYKGSPVDTSQLTPLTISDIKEFYVIEETGHILPTFSITFESGYSWKKYWNENSKLSFTLSVGQNDEKVLNTKMCIISKNTLDLGTGKNLYTATGVYDAPAFVQTPHVRTLGPSKGTEILKAIANVHFKKVEATANSSESMAWYQMNTSDKKFADYVISHSFIDKSFLTCGITMNGTYVLIDTVNQCKQKEKYTIGKDISLLAVPKLRSNSGFLNAAGIYGLDVPIVSNEYGVLTTHRVDLDLGLVSASPPSTGSVERKTLNKSFFSSNNVDKNYYIAKPTYDMGQALMSIEQMEIISNQFNNPIQVLDIVNVLDVITNTTQTYQDSSGKYIVNKVVRGITGNQAILKVVLGRNSHNEQ